MTTKIVEGQYTGEFLLSEVPGSGRLSRDNATVTVPASTKYPAGLVLGKLASGKFAGYSNAGSAGLESARAILYNECDNTDGLAPKDFAAVVIDNDAEVRKTDLQWITGIQSGDKTAAYADLAAYDIKVREGAN